MVLFAFVMAAKAEINIEKCKGCYYCIDVCPAGAIVRSGLSNSKGYDYVEVDRSKCTGCQRCYIVCPDCCFTIVSDSMVKNNK